MNNVDTGKQNSLYQALKLKREQERTSQSDKSVSDMMDTLALDDTQRTKVLSPARLISKRFFRNKLALVGLCLLIFMFMFAFAGPIFYPYSQTQIFYKYDYLIVDYASATERTEYVLYQIPGSPDIRSTVVNRFNAYIADMKSAELDVMSVVAADDMEYTIEKLGDKVYLFSQNSMDQIGMFYKDSEIAHYDRLLGGFDWIGEEFSDDFQRAAIRAIDAGNESFIYSGTRYQVARLRNLFVITLPGVALDLYDITPGEDFIEIIEENLTAGSFEYNGKMYSIDDKGAGAYAVMEEGGKLQAYIASTYVFNAFDVSTAFSDEFRRNALFALYESESFTADGNTYSINTVDNDIFIKDATGQDFATLSIYAIRRYTGQDTLYLDFKYTVTEIIEDMIENSIYETEFTYALHRIDENGNYVYNDDGSPVYEETDIQISRKNTGEFVLTCAQITYLIDIFSEPNSNNLFGTDGDGMDILARMMYGGRVSLLVGFIVVFIEILIGVILGGISGFFGGPIDSLIMRIADIFYCVPGYPILIIMGALFDKLRMDAYQRLMWMMVILGVLGWAGIARLVRGQILSLREQEFMHAQEATGMKYRRRIFRHLVPNVMPQLIVTATMGVGSVIIYESTLSFLGLGVKHPLATWGTMVNSVTSSSEALIRYSYIWLPVGFLICLTVVAFNFVGDGLRDAFDPKMKQ